MVPEGELAAGDTGTVTAASSDGTEAQEVQTKLGLSLLSQLQNKRIFF